MPKGFWSWRKERKERTTPSPPPSAPPSAPSAAEALRSLLFSWSQPPPHFLRPWTHNALLVSSSPAGMDSHLLEFEVEDLANKIKEGSEPLLLPGQHLTVAPMTDATPFLCNPRPYTPVDVSGSRVTLLVKNYPLGVVASSPSEETDQGIKPPRGAFARWLVSLRVGDCVELSGPFGAVALDLDVDEANHEAPSLYLSRVGVALPVRRIAFVAGGSGVTPCAQILNAACARLHSSARSEAAGDPLSTPLPAQCSSSEAMMTNPSGTGPTATHPAPLEFTVLVSDHTPEHALLETELTTLQRQHPHIITSLHRTFTGLVPGVSSTGGASGRRIDVEMLRERLPPPSYETAVLVCGPPGFEASMQAALAEIGHVHIVLLSLGDVHSPAVSHMLLAAHAILTPWAAALRCCVLGDLEERPEGSESHTGTATPTPHPSGTVATA